MSAASPRVAHPSTVQRISRPFDEAASVAVQHIV
jgi:hypothetical protein